MSGKETLKIIDRFVLKHKLGQGTFSYIYEAFDKHLGKDVALKVEKKDKNKTILLFEYNVLLNLKGLKHVAGVYDFVQNSEQNLIVMDLLGINLARARRCLEQTYSLKIAIHILLEMLVAIQEVHDRGFIHRDVKASNFVLCKENRRVFIVDFGLAKKHLNNDMQVMPKRKKADFRGTVSFASLNAHNNIDLARRDDLWSFYFTMLDFLNEKLEWREVRDYSINQVKDIKTKCLKQPQRKLWVGPTQGITEVEQIFNLIDRLQYQDRPNYLAIENLLLAIYNNYDMNGVTAPKPSDRTRETETNTQVTKWQLVQRNSQICPDLQRLNKMMKRTRQQDFMDYFNNHKLCQPSKPQQTNMQLSINQDQAAKAAASGAAIYPMVPISNPPLQFENNANGLANVAKVVDHLGSLVNDFQMPRLQQGHLPLPDMQKNQNVPISGSMPESTGNGLVGSQGVINSSSNLQPLSKLLQNQNFVQQSSQQQRSQFLNKLPLTFNHREPVATPEDEQIQNQNMQHNNFFYNHNMKSQPNLNQSHLTLVNSLTDPYNLMVSDNLNNQVSSMMQQNNSGEHNQHFLMQQQQAQLLQEGGLLGGMHYFPVLDHSLQNFTASNFFAMHSQANNNQQNMGSDYAQNQNGYGQQNTPRLSYNAAQARQIEMFQKMSNGKSQTLTQSQQQMLQQQQANNFMSSLQQPQKLQLQDFQNQSQEICQNLAGNMINGLSHINQQDKAGQLHYLESANQLLRQTAEHHQLNQKLRMQQQQFLSNFQENSKDHQQFDEQAQRNQQQANQQKQQGYSTSTAVKEQLSKQNQSSSAASQQFIQSQTNPTNTAKPETVQVTKKHTNSPEENPDGFQQNQQERTNLHQQQKQIQIMQNEVNRLQQGVLISNQQYQDQKYQDQKQQDQITTRQGLRSQRKDNMNANNENEDQHNNGYGGDAEENQMQHQFKKLNQEGSADKSNTKKRDIKKAAKADEKIVTPGKEVSDQSSALKRRCDGKFQDQKDNQAMINQHIIYAPQIIFMNGQPQKVGDMQGIESQDYGGDKFYYYDPQRIEKSNKPIFKTEKLILNRPGYQTQIQEKFTQQLKERNQVGSGPYDGLPGQDQDKFQPDILPYVDLQEQDGQMNFQLDSDKHDMLNFLPKSLDS